MPLEPARQPAATLRAPQLEESPTRWKTSPSMSRIVEEPARSSPRHSDDTRNVSLAPAEEPSEALGVPQTWSLEVQGSHPIRVPQDISGVRISNPAICDVLRIGPRDLVVVGKAAGVATVRLSLDSETEQIYTFRISRAADGNGEQSPTQMESLLAKAYPGRGIKLEWSRNSLVVKGTASDRQEAIDILTFVRETYLVPVVDQLDVSRGKSSTSR
jgi:Flp pilus assembly secretin CpaC